MTKVEKRIHELEVIKELLEGFEQYESGYQNQVDYAVDRMQEQDVPGYLSDIKEEFECKLAYLAKIKAMLEKQALA